ncbi:hypothetical protein HYU06_03940 [Candidatus Woesearchaeota archaeon]|nr:hypothetical protein [Candidatus Woesearchaeota archaeon]
MPEKITIYQSSAAQTYTCAYDINYSTLNSGQRTYLSSTGTDFTVETGARLNSQYQYKSSQTWTDLMAISVNKWYRIYLTYNNSNDLYDTMIIDVATPSTNATATGIPATIANDFSTIRFQSQTTEGQYYRNVSCWNGTIANEPVQDTTAPLITLVNFTSEGGQDCTSSTCGPTDDTTPTFSITTNENANCRTDDASNNYTTMSGTRNCTSGMGSTSLTCTLGTDDALILGGTDYAYLACQDSTGNENTTTITMNLTGGDLPTNATSAILAGVTDAVLSNPVTYTSQQVYVRYADGTQNLTRFDVVASSGSKRWFFNYILDSDVFTYFRQILPSIYVWENSTLTYSQVRSQVGTLINATK